MRCLFAAMLFAVACAVAVTAAPAGQDTKQPDPKKTQPKGKFDPPKSQKPDEATLKTIAEKTEQLRKAIEALKAKKISGFVLPEVEIYLKAAENIVRFEEWYNAASGKWALTTLDAGLERAKQAEGGKPVWANTPGKWVLRAYRSGIDGSIQPYAVLLPHDYGKDPNKRWRLDIVLHGRDSSLTEAKFIATHQGNAPKDLDYIQLEVYGRGNNAYRWAGEADVFEAVYDSFATKLTFDKALHAQQPLAIDPDKTVLRGFSMGGAGTWHIGLHKPFRFAAIGPGAGFTTTRGYVANLPKELPEYQEKCLHIYDAVDYAENAFNVPIVAYSGEKDAQKAAADNIEKLLKDFKEPVKFTHLIAPGLEHQMPKEWQDKAQAEFKKHLAGPREYPERVRFVTYTPRYGFFRHGEIWALERLHEKAVIDSRRTKDTIQITTQNIAAIATRVFDGDTLTIDGQRVAVDKKIADMIFVKTNGKWAATDATEWSKTLRKWWCEDDGGYLGPLNRARILGPIDDAFVGEFVVVAPVGGGWHDSLSKHAAAELSQFARVWDKYFRGKLQTIKADEYAPKEPGNAKGQVHRGNIVLFGDPESNPLIAKVLPKLPITWTKEKLVVNGVEYDPKTHVPVLIYPNPLNENKTYVVLNSGHTFKEADLKGTNALLYPRLGDWAVIKPTPTDKDPAAYEVVAAGLFDENWQFPKKK